MPGLHTLTRSANRSPYARWHAEAAAGLPRVTLALADLPADRQDLLGQVAQAHGLGYQVKVVLPGPLSLLWQVPGALERLSATLDRYDALLLALADAGVDWVQLDEPLLLQHLPQPWGAAFEGAYNRLQRVPLQLLLACPGWPAVCRWMGCMLTCSTASVSWCHCLIVCRPTRCCRWA